MEENKKVIDSIPIESHSKKIRECFKQHLYEIPRFQRPYSWEEEQLIEYWNDVVKAKSDFFLGSVVTWTSQKRENFNHSYSIIDGQQRLTTSTIILSVIRDMFKQLKDGEQDQSIIEELDEQIANTQNYITVKDDEGNVYPVLSRVEQQFKEEIQKLNSIPSKAKWTKSAERIGSARSFFENKIKEEMDLIDPKKHMDRLKEIRNNVLKAQVIQIELSSEEDGFLIFETLNTRGTDLMLSDLVKNLLIRKCGNNSYDRDVIADRWDQVVDSVQEHNSGSDAIDKFIWQSWNSRRKSVTKKELFKEISALLTGDLKLHRAYLEELETDREIYSNLNDIDIVPRPNRQNCKSAWSVKPFVDSLRAIAMFKIELANSILISMVRKYESSSFMKDKHLIELARLVECFHFQYNALTKSTSTGGNRGRWNKYAIMIEEANSASEIDGIISELAEVLKKSLPDQAKVKAAFVKLFYAPKAKKLAKSDKEVSNKSFIAYVLSSFAKYDSSLPSGSMPDDWSIEHIVSQSETSLNLDKDYIHSIGNLVLIVNKKNQEMGNYPVNEKWKTIGDYAAYKDDVLKEWIAKDFKSISKDDVKIRAKSLADLALEKVWKIK